MSRDAKAVANRVSPKRVGDVMHGSFVHSSNNANKFSNCQANTSGLRQIIWPHKIGGMTEKARPFSDIAARLEWHRNLMDMTQSEYAASIGKKRAAYSLWEAGTHRLSLDGALALRKKYGLSLDFMYEGIDDALPMTLRNAWRERP